jgi:hypothetical protein
LPRRKVLPLNLALPEGFLLSGPTTPLSIHQIFLRRNSFQAPAILPTVICVSTLLPLPPLHQLEPALLQVTDTGIAPCFLSGERWWSRPIPLGLPWSSLATCTIPQRLPTLTVRKEWMSEALEHPDLHIAVVIRLFLPNKQMLTSPSQICIINPIKRQTYLFICLCEYSRGLK